jgi:hypothetical protein
MGMESEIRDLGTDRLAAMVRICWTSATVCFPRIAVRLMDAKPRKVYFF